MPCLHLPDVQIKELKARMHQLISIVMRMHREKQVLKVAGTQTMYFWWGFKDQYVPMTSNQKQSGSQYSLKYWHNILHIILIIKQTFYSILRHL